MLLYIFELEILDPYGIAFLDACCLERIDNARIDHRSLEILDRIVVIEISGAHRHLRPYTGNNESTAVVTLDGKLLFLLELIYLLIFSDDIVKDNGRKLAYKLRYLVSQLLYSDTCSCTYDEYILESLTLNFIDEHLDLFIACSIALVGYNDLRSCREIGIELNEFIVDGIKIIDGIPAVRSGYVYYMDKKTCSLDMTKEIVSKACTFVCILDDTRDIRDNK